MDCVDEKHKYLFVFFSKVRHLSVCRINGRPVCPRFDDQVTLLDELELVFDIWRDTFFDDVLFEFLAKLS